MNGGLSMRQFSSKTLIAWSLAALLGLLFTAGVVAQTTTGNLQGVVQDPNKAVVAGATVKITNVDTGIANETSTNGEGFYRVTNLIPGEHYKVEVTGSGYAPKAIENIRILLATENTTDVQLEVAGTQNVVVVTAETPLIQSTQNQLSQSYSVRQLTQLPING